MFRVAPSLIIRSAYYCIYSIWYLSHRYCYLPLSRNVSVTVWQIPDAVDTVVCAPDDEWRYHPKHAEQFLDINKLCKFTSCWIYIKILLAHRILHISRIRVDSFIFAFIVSLCVKHYWTQIPPSTTIFCMISGCCRDVNETFAVCIFYRAHSGNSVPTFRDNLSVGNYRCTLPRISEERISHKCVYCSTTSFWC